MTDTVADLTGTAPDADLNKALAAAQGEFPPIPAGETVDTGTYSYNYASLATIIAATRPALSKHGLALVQRLEAPGGVPSLRTELRHAAGGCIAASFPLPTVPQNVQQLGSLLTYLRRYALVAILAVAAEDDDDGAQAADVAAPHTYQDEPMFQAPDLKDDVVEDLTAAQRKKIFAIRTKLIDAGRFTDQEFKARLLDQFNVDSVSGLSKDQASTLITWLLAAEAAVDKGGTP